MGKIERVMAVVERRRPDRPPISFWHHFVGPDQQTGPGAVRAHLEHLERYDLDFLKIMNDHPYPGAGTGPTVDELADLPVLRGDEAEFASQLDVIAALVRTLNGQVLLTATVFNAWTTLRSLYRPKHRRHNPPNLSASADPVAATLTRLVREHRDVLAAALERIAQSLANFAAKCVEAGADGVFLSVRDDWVDTPDNGGAGTYASLVRPGDLRILQGTAGGPFNLLHVCGRPLDLAAFGAYSVQGINWADRAAGPSIGQVADSFGPAICGGLDNLSTLPDATPGDCAGEVFDAVGQAGDRPIVICPGCTYDPDRVPHANLMAVCEAARRARSAN